MSAGYRALSAAVLHRAIADYSMAKRALGRGSSETIRAEVEKRIKSTNRARKSAGKPLLSKLEKQGLAIRVRKEIALRRRLLVAEIEAAKRFLTTPSVWHEWVELSPAWFAERMGSIDWEMLQRFTQKV